MELAGLARRAGTLAAAAGLTILGLTATAAQAPAATAGTAAPRAVSAAPVTPPAAAAAPGSEPGSEPGLAAGSGTAPVTLAPAVPPNASFVTSPQVIASASRGIEQVCPTPARPGQMACMALLPSRVRPTGTDLQAADGYQPAVLQEAYGLTSAAASAGSGRTVAIVDAYNDAAAGPDLSTYRSQLGLPACSTSGGCLRIVNQAGGSALPAADSTGAWQLEESLDLDMVSAICPNCKILLVEAKSDNIPDLATAEHYAVRHANVVSNSWGSGAEFIGENAFDTDFNYPGVPVVAAAGDSGYGTQYPAASQFVTAVGGTTLTGATSSSPGRQQAWAGTGSGCSSLEARPSWQTVDAAFAGCGNRTEADVSADADPSTGVAVFDSFKGGGWRPVGGTSVAAPLIAAVYALAGGALPGSYPASYPYLKPAGLTDVTSGTPNGSCEPDRSYLCQARVGYDGPTGLGTPDGTGSFAGPSAALVTVIDPGTRDYQAGSRVHLQIQALDSARAALSFTSTGLPAGLRLGSADGLISGQLTGRPGSYAVRVTAAGAGGARGSVRFTIAAVSRITDRHPGSGRIRLDLGDKCLTDADDSPAAGTRIEIWRCDLGRSQRWAYIAGHAPGGAGQLMIHGKCLSIGSGTSDGARATLQRCTGSAGQQWADRSLDQLASPHSGKCLDDPGKSRKNGTQVVLWSCSTSGGESWQLPPGPVLSGLAGQCLTDPGNSASAGTRIEIATCDGRSSQKWVLKRSGRLQIRGKCLDIAGASRLDGAAAQLAGCSGSASQQWAGGPGGELLTTRSGRCLADQGSKAASGTRLVQEDCYGQPGEIWSVG
jgi:hypothetical protein